MLDCCTGKEAKNKRLKRIAVYAICVVIFLIFAEVFARYKGYVPHRSLEYLNSQNFYPVYDNILGGAPLAPAHHRSDEAKPYMVYENISAAGARVSRLNDKNNSKVRVLMLGCSYLYGMGIQDQETCTWLLNDRFPDVTFDNYAFPGYGTYQCLKREELILSREHYDLVIYAPICNHVLRNCSPCIWMKQVANNTEVEMAEFF